MVDFGELRIVRKIIVKNGYNKKEGLFYSNSRVRTLQLIFSGGQTRQALVLKDQPGKQVFKIAGSIKARWVQLKIQSVIQGQKYTDTGLNELRIISSALAQ